MSYFSPHSDVPKGVRFGKNCYVASFAALRDDEGEIVVGDNVSIQEGCVVHGRGVVIGSNVTVGHGAIVHGCRVGDNVLIGMRATLLTGCEIGAESIVAAGALVTEGMKVPPRSVVMGMPAKVVRGCTPKDLERIRYSYQSYLDKLKTLGRYEG